MNTRNVKTAALCAALAIASQARSAELPLPKDGWVSWQVDAVEDAPAFCCWSSWKEDSPAETCHLDGDREGYGTRNHSKTDSVRIYARFAGGKLERLRSLAAACPVDSKSSIQKLDNVATDDSARWLIGVNKAPGTAPAARHDVGEDTLIALAMHRGPLAMDALTTLARGDTRVETRKQAIFWLAQARGVPGADIVSTAMFNDQDAEVRKHASFAITESKSPHIAADLIRLGDTDKDSDVRAQAWFWLAHTGAANAEDAITAALKKDQDDHVREQAIFALSQLPDERGTKALIAAAQDQSLSHEQRKRALFWLAQSKSDGAQAYVDKVLAGNAAR